MRAFVPRSTTEQLTEHLRAEISTGHLRGEMPGVHQLAKDYGVSPRTVIGAARQLEDEGILRKQGAGRRSAIVLPDDLARPALKIAILRYEKVDAQSYYRVDLQHQLLESGYAATFVPVSLVELGMEVDRVARLVERTEADAWIVFSGSRGVLQWFAEQSTPALALAGRRRGVTIASAGPDKVPAVREAVRKLASLGHRRIVYLTREERRKPLPGLLEQGFLDELEMQGINAGPYHLPEWESSRADFFRCLDALFAHTPPTALFIDEMPFFIAAQQHLARLGILAPRDVSLICTDPDPAFDWCEPSVAHIGWDPRPMVRRIMRWADNVARGQEDRRHSFSKAAYVHGGTVGRAPRQ